MFKPTLQFQSTHPLRDATLSSSDNCDNFVDFNPRTPYGMRLETPFFVLFSLKFQSTHPLRDATLADSIVNVFSAISIHAPLTGCDIRRTRKYQKLRIFQSTHPLRDATECCGMSFSEEQFQSTHPLRDATPSVDFDQSSIFISIHAPLTGCDTRHSRYY